MDNIEAKIKEAICKISKVSVQDIKTDSRLADVGIDSFAGIDLVYTLEDMFTIKISDTEMSGMKTVKDIIDAVNSRIDTNK